MTLRFSGTGIQVLVLPLPGHSRHFWSQMLPGTAMSNKQIWAEVLPLHPSHIGNVQMWLFNYGATYYLVTDEDPVIFATRDVYRAIRLNWKNVNWLWLNKYHCWAFVLPKQPYLSAVIEKGVKTESFPHLSSLPFYVETTCISFQQWLCFSVKCVLCVCQVHCGQHSVVG